MSCRVWDGVRTWFRLREWGLFGERQSPAWRWLKVVEGSFGIGERVVAVTSPLSRTVNKKENPVSDSSPALPRGCTHHHVTPTSPPQAVVRRPQLYSPDTIYRLCVRFRRTLLQSPPAPSLLLRRRKGTLFRSRDVAPSIFVVIERHTQAPQVEASAGPSPLSTRNIHQDK